MTLELSSMITLTVLAAPSLLLIMLLPTLIEIKKPKDAGPRLIMSDSVKLANTLRATTLVLEDIEDRQELDFLIKPLVRDALSILHSVEI